MSEVSCILVCVTAQKNCARLIDRGRALSARLHMPVRVLHVAAAAHSSGQPGGAEILNELFSLAHQADAEMEILYDPQPAEAIARLSENVFADMRVAEEWQQTLSRLLDLAAAVPIYHLACTPDRSAVDALAQALACSP